VSLPETWTETYLGQLVTEIQLGFAQSPGEEDAGTTPQIRTHNVSPEGQITLKDIKYVLPSEGELARYSLRRGDIVFNNTNSEEWVGKTALFDLDGSYVFSNHMTRLRVQESRVIPEYLSRYLHLLWRIGYSRQRGKRWVNQAAIDQDTLLTFKISLPTRPEQERILSLLKQAESLWASRLEFGGLLDEVIRAAYGESFGKYFASGKIHNEVRLADYIETQYGLAEPMESHGTHAILRMNNLTVAGWLDLSDLKYVSLSPEDGAAYDLRDGDLLFNRTNSRELVGKTAIWRDQEGAFTFASYQIRIRLRSGLLPEFVWATLNNAYGKHRLHGMAKQSVSMANISASDLGRFALPLPPREEQERFARFVRQIAGLRQRVEVGNKGFQTLLESMTREAMTGRLTESWRDTHLGRSRREAQQFPEAPPIQVLEVKDAPPASEPSPEVAERAWLEEQLSEFQKKVLRSLQEWDRPFIPEDEALDEFCRSVQSEPNQNVHPRILHALEQLTALGLIAKIATPNVRGEYSVGYRALLRKEHARHWDVQALVRALQQQVEGEA
jgi:type I restriction enzyme S subunit